MKNLYVRLYMYGFFDFKCTGIYTNAEEKNFYLCGYYTI